MLERWLALGGADLDDRADAVTAGLGLGVQLDPPMTALSGGQAARAALASLLLSRYDVFLLDEPTNDLDLDGLARLERVRPGSARRGGARQSRPRVPRPDRDPSRRNRPGPTAGATCTAVAMTRIWTSARSRGGTRAKRTKITRRPAPLLERARTQRAWMEKGVRNARRKTTDNDKFAAFRAETAKNKRRRHDRPSG